MPDPTLLNVQQIGLTGLLDDMTKTIDKVNGNWFANDGRTFIYAKNNDSVNAITLTVDSVTPCSYGFDHEVSIEVSAGTSKMVGPFQTGRFNNPGGKVKVTYIGSPTDVNIGIFRL